MVPFAGVRLGHATHPQFPTGCTVFLCPLGTYGSVDSRGPAPGSRELALLAPDKPDDKEVNAIVLTGGCLLYTSCFCGSCLTRLNRAAGRR